MGLSEFRAPPASADADQKSGWFRECIQSGSAWLRSQRPYNSIAEAKQLILEPNEAVPVGQSAVNIPRTKRDIRELVSILSNLRATASNKTDNAQYYPQAEILNKVDLWNWARLRLDRKFRSAFQAAALTGTAYVSHVYSPDALGRGKGGIRTDIYEADQVYLINPPRDHDLQKCYAVVFKQRVPLHIVQSRFPLRAHEIVADHGATGMLARGTAYAQSMSPAFTNSPLRHLGGQFDSEDVKSDDIFPTCDIYEMYILDLSLNMTDHEVTMGQPGTSWEYKVPAFGSLIPTGTNTWEGLPAYRKANIEDARLYPLRRKMVGTGQGLILYDDTSEWWHGMVPASRFSFDDWWCEALGFPLTRDVASIENDANSLLRGISDGAQVRLDPPLNYDENAISERLALRLNPRQKGQRTKVNQQFGPAITPLLPPGYSDLPLYIPDLAKFLYEQVDFVIGRTDVQAIANARQIPSADSIEKIREMSGPLAEDMTRNMESCMTELGDLRRWYVFQFLPKKQRMEILGENGLVAEDFDFDPGTLIPSHMPDEDAQAGPSRYSLVDRARIHAGQFFFRVLPNSMARLTTTSNKLMLLQLQSHGFPIDPWTLAELFEIENFGQPPPNCPDIITRWVAWAHIQAELAAEAQAGLEQPAKQGRPATGLSSPRIRQKDGGTRSTISQSG
jgi:hypothetical protein